jgi:hypothetical protein
VRLLRAVDAACLQAEDWLVVAEQAREVAQVHHVAALAAHAKQRRAVAVRLERDDRGPLAQELHVLAAAGLADALGDQPAELAHGWRLDHQRERDVHVPVGFDLGADAHGDQRVAAEIEEVVRRAHAIDAECLGPQRGELALDVGLGGDVLAA